MHAAEMTLLFAYNRWANQRIMEAARPITAEQFLAPSTFPQGSLRGTLGHMLRNEWGWCTRLRGGQPARPPSLRDEDFPTVAAMGMRWAEIEARTQAYIASLEDTDLTRIVTLGPDSALPVWQILMHLYTHSVQHRGEAAQMLTDQGHSPGDIDFFFFARDQ